MGQTLQFHGDEEEPVEDENHETGIELLATPQVALLGAHDQELSGVVMVDRAAA